MIKEIIISDDVYLADQRVAQLTEGYDLVRTSSFTEAEITILRQQSLFGKTAVVVSGKLDKSEEELLQRFLDEDHRLTSALIYLPGYEDYRKKIFKSNHTLKCEKLKGSELLNFLVQIGKDNFVPVDTEILRYLIEYSEYESDPKISLYDLIGVIRSSTGSVLTKEHIEKNLIRSDKEDAFKLIQLIGDNDGLVEYMDRLNANPHMIIGALLYAFRIMAKLKISSDIGINSYQMNQYMLIKDKWSLEQIVEKMKLLNMLKEQHESNDVMRALILSVLEV